MVTSITHCRPLRLLPVVKETQTQEVRTHLRGGDQGSNMLSITQYFQSDTLKWWSLRKLSFLPTTNKALRSRTHSIAAPTAGRDPVTLQWTLIIQIKDSISSYQVSPEIFIWCSQMQAGYLPMWLVEKHSLTGWSPNLTEFGWQLQLWLTVKETFYLQR